MNGPADVYARIGEWMAAGEIAPTPTNYEFWYRYVTGADGELVDAVDAVQRTLGRVSTAAMANIRRELYGGTARTNMSRLIDETERQLERMAGLVERSETNARDYRERLGDGQDSLRDDAPADHHRTLIAAIIEQTSAMIEKTSHLEEELAQSSSEVMALRHDLEIARCESRTDPLTGLSNRKACVDYLEANVLRATIESHPLSLVFIDIDHFKRFNDSFSHRVGDEVLRLVASAIERFFHGAGLPARWGGDEFVVVASGRGLDEVAAIAERFRDHVASREIRARGHEEGIGRVTLSIGVAQLRHEETPQQLIDRADAALYDAKAEGRNRLCLAAETRRAA